MSRQPANWPDRSKAVAIAIRELTQEMLNEVPGLTHVSLTSSTVARAVSYPTMFSVYNIGSRYLNHVNAELRRTGARLDVSFSPSVGRFYVDVAPELAAVD